MIKTLRNVLKADKESFKVPNSVKQTIPVKRLWPDGTFQVGNKFSRTFRFTDINYSVASRDAKLAMFLQYCDLLNALEIGSTTKITINNRRMTKGSFAQNLLKHRDDGLDEYRDEYNNMIMDAAIRGNGIIQDKYITVSVIKNTYVHQYAMTYKEAAQHYAFDENQIQMLEEMMSPAYYSYYAALIGVDVYGGADYTQIISHLPPNSKGAEVVKAAMTRLGCPYVWGAKGSTKFDCSGLAYWSIKQVDPVLGDRMYTNAAGQAKYCYDRGLTVGRSELQPGDLVFWVNKKCEGCHRWKEIHHVGIYIGEGKVIEAASGKGRVLIRDLWESKNYPILMFGRPYQ